MTWTTRFFIFLGANPNAKCPIWSTFTGQPLTNATMDRGTIAALIDGGANLETLNNNLTHTKPPIVHSNTFWHGGKRISRAILKRKDVDLNAVDHNGHTALHNAILFRTDVSFAVSLINHPSVNIYARTPEGKSARDLLKEILEQHFLLNKSRERALKILKALTTRHNKKQKAYNAVFTYLPRSRAAITPSYQHILPKPYITDLREESASSPLASPTLSTKRDRTCHASIGSNRRV